MKAIHIATQPPQAIEMEQAVLGALMLERKAFSEIGDFLSADAFYDLSHRSIYSAIETLQGTDSPVDILTVTGELRRTGKLTGDLTAVYVSSLTNKVASSANIQFHARIIQQKYILRALSNVGAKLVDIADETDVFEVLDWVNEQVGRLNAITTQADPSDAASIMARMVDNREMPLYITADLGDLDRHFAMGPAQVTAIGARPGIGKTALALTMAMNIARQGHAVLFITLEMSAEDLTARIASCLTGIDSERITRNDLTDEERARIAQANTYNGTWIPRILFEDLSTVKAGQIFGILAKAVKKHGCKVAILDYIQLMTGEGDNGAERMSNISKACKQAAKSSGIRLIELSQLRRGDHAETDPGISDLRESGQLEADADVVMLLGRERGSERLLVKVAKNKKGPTGEIELLYNLRSQQIGPALAPPNYNANARIEPQRDEQTGAPPF